MRRLVSCARCPRLSLLCLVVVVLLLLHLLLLLLLLPFLFLFPLLLSSLLQAPFGSLLLQQREMEERNQQQVKSMYPLTQQHK